MLCCFNAFDGRHRSFKIYLCQYVPCLCPLHNFRSSLVNNLKEKFENTKGVIRTRWSKDKLPVCNANKKENKGKEWNTKHYTENYRLSNTNLTMGERRGRQCLLHYSQPSCYSCLQTTVMLWMMEGPISAYDKWNISVVICDTDIP